MIIPTQITKKQSKQKESTFFTICYNGKELGKVSIHNIFSSAGVQGVRLVWQEKNAPFDSKKMGVVYEYVDKDDKGNIRHTK